MSNMCDNNDSPSRYTPRPRVMRRMYNNNGGRTSDNRDFYNNTADRPQMQQRRVNRYDRSANGESPYNNGNSQYNNGGNKYNNNGNHYNMYPRYNHSCSNQPLPQDIP